MEPILILARLDSAEIAALTGAVLFLAIMGYLLFSGGSPKEEPKPPKPGR